MILNSLTVTDYRVFRGTHKFDLAPRTKYRKKRPIILFGGLNGAGKTTILTAVTLALYGKQHLKGMVAQKAYDEHLRKSIHNSRDSLVHAQSASVQIDFSYSSVGVLNQYSVKRSWMLKSEAVKESLIIKENGKVLSELTAEQCQGFLNELIPIGVSELFFFDGEKIKELAEDSSGTALGSSIKKLLGLDLIDTLSADLATLVRQNKSSQFSIESKKESEALELSLTEAEREAENGASIIQELMVKATFLESEITQSEKNISAKGGAWAKTRDSEKEKLSKLIGERGELQNSIRDCMSGSLPLALVPEFSRSVLEQLEAESVVKHSIETSKLVNKRIGKVKKLLRKQYEKEVADDVISTMEKEFNIDVGNVEILHDISDSQLAFLKSTVQIAETTEMARLSKMQGKLNRLNKKIAGMEENQSRAPHDEALKPFMEELTELHISAGKIRSDLSEAVENRRKSLREAIDIARELIKQELAAGESAVTNQALDNANGARNVLTQFTKSMAERKVADLESEFVLSIAKFARKEDVKMNAKISPVDFSVNLVDDRGIELDKAELSAGEKQIYAIAVLEALARTSGRKLPIIIDTPLGRLDSVHRGKLVDHYFPYASHQVIMLSTDTEVDQSYYDRFSSSISHAYKLEYDPMAGSTSAKEGYFWKTKDLEDERETA